MQTIQPEPGSGSVEKDEAFADRQADRELGLNTSQIEMAGLSCRRPGPSGGGRIARRRLWPRCAAEFSASMKPRALCAIDRGIPHLAARDRSLWIGRIARGRAAAAPPRQNQHCRLIGSKQGT